MSGVPDKDDLLRFRISKHDKQWFESICKRQGQVPAKVMRRLVHEYCHRHSEPEEGLCEVTAWKPEEYDWGAYRVQALLSNKISNDFAVQFRLPKLSERSIISDEGYRGAVVDSETGIPHEAGVFRGRIWMGHIYSNGTSEIENKTHRDEVVRALRQAIEVVASVFLPGSDMFN